MEGEDILEEVGRIHLGQDAQLAGAGKKTRYPLMRDVQTDQTSESNSITLRMGSLKRERERERKAEENLVGSFIIARCAAHSFFTHDRKSIH